MAEEHEVDAERVTSEIQLLTDEIERFTLTAGFTFTAENQLVAEEHEVDAERVTSEIERFTAEIRRLTAENQLRSEHENQSLENQSLTTEIQRLTAEIQHLTTEILLAASDQRLTAEMQRLMYEIQRLSAENQLAAPESASRKLIFCVCDATIAYDEHFGWCSQNLDEDGNKNRYCKRCIRFIFEENLNKDGVDER